MKERNIRVAALQFCPAFLDVEKNLMIIEQYLLNCDAELAVIPELSTTGYFFQSKEQLASVAETVNGRTARMFKNLAISRKMVIVAGFAECEGERYYNSALTAFPDGRSFLYRKTHLFGEEKRTFTPGDTGFRVFEYEGICIGVMICYDWRFPESVRTLALRGAHIICHPSDLVALPKLWKPVMQTRSFENKVFTITANRTGTEVRGNDFLTFHGCSQITDVKGKIIAETDNNFEGWIFSMINPSEALDKSFSPFNDIFSDRRPEMYER